MCFSCLFHVLKCTKRPDGAILFPHQSGQSTGFPPPTLLTHSQYSSGRKGPRKEEIRSSQATAPASVYQNGQPRGGGFTGGVSESSGGRSTVHPACRGREAELPQLQRSDTRWCCVFTFHSGAWRQTDLDFFFKRFGGGISLA